jgi:hypothetical protein
VAHVLHMEEDMRNEYGIHLAQDVDLYCSPVGTEITFRVP